MTPDEEAALAELVWEMTKPHSQGEIAKHLGIAQQRVSEIEQSAMAKLRALADPIWGTDAYVPGRNIVVTVK